MEWQDIGRILKQQREKRGYNREDVYKATKISIMNIEALEEGDFDSLPHPIYTKAFIKAYAEFLELDPSEFVEAYEGTINTTLKKSDIKPIIKSSSIGKGIWIIVGFILLILVTILFFYLINRNDSSNKTPHIPSVFLKKSEIEKMTGNTSVFVKRDIITSNNTQEKREFSKDLNKTSSDMSINSKLIKNSILNGSEKKEIKIPTMEAKESLSNSSIKQDIQTKEHILKVVANAPCWLKGEYDKNGTKEAYLLKGQKVIFKFTKTLKVKFGNLGGVDIFFDGKKIQINGRKGEVKTIIFPFSNN